MCAFLTCVRPGVNSKVLLSAEPLLTLTADIWPLVGVCTDVYEHLVPVGIEEQVSQKMEAGTGSVLKGDKSEDDGTGAMREAGRASQSQGRRCLIL